MERARILIVDDHEIVRKGLRSLVESCPQLEICGEAADGIEAVEATVRLAPDIVVMDISMPKVNGLDATKQIREKVPRTRVLILSQHDSSQMVNAAKQAGAVAYIAKTQVAHDLLTALEAVSRGQSFDWTHKGFSS
jgi:two-component system, NarL family, response regulator NreC